MVFKDTEEEVYVKSSDNYIEKADNFVFQMQEDEKIVSITMLFGNFCCARAF